MSADSRSQIKPGDVVILRSGSLKMTVDEVADEWGTVKVYCSWFDGKSIVHSSFPITSVKIAD